MGLCSWIISVPFLTALAVIFTPASQWKAIRWISAIGTGIQLALTAVLTYGYWTAAAPDTAATMTAKLTRLYFVERVPWFESLGIQYFVGVDGISVAMIILTSIIFSRCAAADGGDPLKEFFAAAGAGDRCVRRVRRFDLFLFFMFCSAVLPMYADHLKYGTKEYWP